MNTRRPHRYQDAGRLADLPLDVESSPAVLRLEVATTGSVQHNARVTAFTCLPEDSWSRSEALAFVPRVVSATRVARDEQLVRFESDATTVRAQIALAEHDFYGAGEVAGELRRNGRTVEFWNNDAWRYADDTPALYQSHPFVLSLAPDGRVTGVLADCARRGALVFATDGLEFQFEGGPYTVYLLQGETPAEVLAGLAGMTGTIELPPLWALGYHQCRYSYMDQAEVREVASRMRAERVPCDALWFDIDYMQDYRVFTWETANASPIPRV